MRADIILRRESGARFVIRGSYRTRQDAHDRLEDYRQHKKLDPGDTAELEPLALIPHPEFFAGPYNELTRLSEEIGRMLREAELVGHLAAFLDGVQYEREREAGHPLNGRESYVRAREVMLSRGFAYELACRIALRATAALGLGTRRPLGILEPF